MPRASLPPLCCHCSTAARKRYGKLPSWHRGSKSRISRVITEARCSFTRRAGTPSANSSASLFSMATAPLLRNNLLDVSGGGLVFRRIRHGTGTFNHKCELRATAWHNLMLESACYSVLVVEQHMRLKCAHIRCIDNV